ncbi:tetratricopeptide repeat-containing sensor histidine kinase [Robiginitalea sp. M366]|uniref:ATP-binding protein n=1 Tax=Robiginitalea aestuariiviva TaxID=3036903 RepID=UPI00240E4DF1|nr:tetratricopeptide repeat-containing sensor histidine kinase [Robiginitalea aestuariiviva]MDG1572657.1 tetratricopeptide repeat-containing sensor histidine kinase [Robiginitalea aestuariiviva]
MVVAPARGQIVDSLEARLTHPGLSTAERTETLYLLSRELTFVDLDRALSYGEQSLKLAQNSGDVRGMAYAYRILGSIFSKKEDYFLGMQSLHRAMDLFRKDNDSIGLANCYISLGHIYRRLENRKKEVESHKKAYDFFKNLGVRERYGVAAHNLGESYYLAGQLSEAETLTDVAIEINTEIGNLPVLSNCLKVKGLIEMSRGNSQEAEIQFKRILDISSNLGPNAQKVSAAEALMQMAAISALHGNAERELDYLLQAEALAKENDMYAFLERAYHQLTLYHLRMGNSRTAHTYTVAQRKTTDMFHEKLIADRSQLTEGMVEIDALNQRTSFLENQTAMQSAEIRTRNVLLIIIGICVLLLLWFVRKTWWMNRKLRENNTIITNQKSELETLNATKDKFFSVVAHDIRSPLNALKSFTSLLTENYDLMTANDVKTMGKQLDRSVTNTLRMADNLILWATHQMKKTPDLHETFSLQEVLREIYEVFRDVAQQKEITLMVELNTDVAIYGNRNQVEFIIRNLVNNALKYTPRNGKVSLSVRQETKGQVSISVTDTGVGMDDKVIAELFTLNAEKSRKGTEGEKGSGLGLTLSYEFARRNNGTIEVESAPDQGTTFCVTFPREAQAA